MQENDDVQEHDRPLTKGERREARRKNERKMRVTGRSVFLLEGLGLRPKDHRKGKR